MVGAAGIVAGTLTGILAKEHASGIDDLLGESVIVVGLDYEMFGGIGIGEGHCLVIIRHNHELAVVESFGCYLLAGKQVELTLHFIFYLFKC